MKTHRTLMLILSFCLIVFLVGCGSKSKSFELNDVQFELNDVQFELNDVQKVVLTSSSGQVKNTILYKETINQITDNITSIQFSRDKSSKNTNGFGTIVEWYGNNDNRILSISINDEQTIQYDGYFWKAQNGSINTILIYNLLAVEDIPTAN